MSAQRWDRLCAALNAGKAQSPAEQRRLGLTAAVELCRPYGHRDMPTPEQVELVWEVCNVVAESLAQDGWLPAGGSADLYAESDRFKERLGHHRQYDFRMAVEYAGQILETVRTSGGLDRHREQEAIDALTEQPF